jgi:Tol biopolymer transport system component
MGEVYRARDTRLDRIVAIKILPPAVASDPERRARFEREAKTVAALSHPHICTLHDVGEDAASVFLVMEYLEGQTLAERLQKGPVPVDEAIQYGADIAAALAAAHRSGIVHRDLKPGNVIITKSGVKLLDFGLAKLRASAEHATFPAASVPTHSRPLTAAGGVMGTLQYMAPEQLEGRATDARTDIWALGLVLYEMVTGKRAFDGRSNASVIVAILEREPVPAASLCRVMPPGLERLISRCLSKSPEDRWDSAHDLADELWWIMQSDAGAPARRSATARWWTIARTGALVAAGTAAGAAIAWQLEPRSVPGRVVHSLVDVGPAEEVNSGGHPSSWIPTPGGSRTSLAWAPDGGSLVFVGRAAGVQQLYVRSLDTDGARPIPRTEGAQLPVISADGRWVAFWANGAIRKVLLAGGPVTTLLSGQADPPVGLAWGVNGGLLYSSAGIIWRGVSGMPSQVTRPREGDWGPHQLPQWLPGETAFLYTIRKGEQRATGSLVAQRLATGEVVPLLSDGVDGRYVAGRLLFMRQGVLYGVPFDADRLQVIGEPVALMSDVSQALSGYEQKNITGAGQFSVSRDGSLAYVPGSVVPYPESSVVTIGRDGSVSASEMPPRSYLSVRVSRDRRKIAAVTMTLEGARAFTYDIDRGVLTPVAGPGEVFWPIWSPEGDMLAFAEFTGGISRLVTLPNGSARKSTLVEPLASDSYSGPSSWSAIRDEIVGLRNGDIWVFPAAPGGKPRPLLETAAAEMWPELSPDGQWLAYGSDVSGRTEIYVQPYPGPGTVVQVSAEGGRSPAWSARGDELFFLTPPDRANTSGMMAVSVSVAAASALQVGAPRRLFSFDHEQTGFDCWPLRCYDLAGDGARFLVVQTPRVPPPPAARYIHLVQNWIEELNAKVQPSNRR